MTPPNVCQICFGEPGVHRFVGLVPALIGDACLKRAHEIRDDAKSARAQWLKPKKSARKAAAPPDMHRRVVRGRVVFETAEQRAKRLKRVAETRPSRALPSGTCRGCGGVIVRTTARGPIPARCDDCHEGPPRRHPVPVVRAGAVA